MTEKEGGLVQNLSIGHDDFDTIPIPVAPADAEANRVFSSDLAGLLRNVE